MSLFDFFKKKSRKEIPLDMSGETIIKQQAILDDPSKTIDEKNAAYIAIRNEEERRLNAAYDFNSVDGINNIPVPCKEVNGGSATGRVEYYLRGRCFARHWDAGRIDLAIACLRKANQLMYVSDMIWKKDDFMRLVYYLRKAGKNDEADEEQKKIEDYFERKNEFRDSFTQRLESAAELDTDLVEISNSGICCPECAKFRNRIYSITGKDKRFPALPAQFKPDTFTYNHFCLSIWPFVYGIMEPSFECEDIVKYSNRPFVDDRTAEEISHCNNWKEQQIKEAERKEKLRQEALENQARIERIRKDYEWVLENLPEECPKSFSAYSRMRSGNTTGYQRLQKLAADMGHKI